MQTRLAIVTGVLWLYVSLRFVWLLPGGLGFQVPLAILLLLIAEYQQFTSRWCGTMASPELPRPWLVLLGWVFGGLLLLFLLLVARDLVGVLVWLAAPGAGIWWWTASGPAVGLGVFAALLAGWGTWQGVRVPGVKTVQLDVAGLPAVFDGYRMVQLSDLHASRLLPAAWVSAVVTRANALDADLVVITGDLQDGAPALRAGDVAPLARLRAHDGVLAIPGNHEYYADYRAWMTAFGQLGLAMLINAHRLIERDGAAIAVAGVTDRQAAAFHDPPPDLEAALAGIPTATCTVLLQHRPGSARRNAAAGVALQLSGHTHGGQIVGLSELARRGNGGFVSGLYRVGAMQLYVSNGTGLWNGLLLRLGKPAEITQLVLHPAPA
ncbi:MAG TPA: metallophosphoesterase [Nevskiaceae bacterium]|nr:metallophosphoesterase [Nevskiaceae bacterium]